MSEIRLEIKIHAQTDAGTLTNVLTSPSPSPGSHFPMVKKEVVKQLDRKRSFEEEFCWAPYTR